MDRDDEISRIAAAMNGRIAPEDVRLGRDLAVPAARLYDAGLRVSARAKVIRIKRPRRRTLDWRLVGNVAACRDCTAHFGVGYGPLEGAKLGAARHFHRLHGHADRWPVIR